MGSTGTRRGIQSVQIADGVNLDSFSRLRVSSSQTLFDSQQEYGIDFLRLWDAVLCDASGGPSYTYSYTAQMTPFGGISNAAGSAVGPRNANTRMVPITAAPDNGDYAILQTRQYPRYVPGKGLLAFITGVFATAADPTVKLVVRSSTSGTPSDSEFANQADWNIDPFDGSGPSGITLDFTKTQILVIQAQWLGVGRVVVGFDVNGVLYPAHQFIEHANNIAVPYTQTFNLPIRLEAQTVASTTESRVGIFDKYNGVFLQCAGTGAGGTINFVCCSIQSEGGEEIRGFPHSVSNGTTSIGVTTRRPILSIRPAQLYNFITNRTHIDIADCELYVSGQACYYELVMGGTLTNASWIRKGTPITAGSFITGLTYVITSVGTTNFTLIGAASNTVGLEFVATGAGTGTGTAVLEASSTEYDVSATAITGGIVIDSGSIPAGGSVRTTQGSLVDIRGPLTLSKIDDLTAMQGNFSLVCTAYTGTSNISGMIHWHEQVV